MSLRRTASSAALVLIAVAASAQSPERVRPNDNRARAGIAMNAALAVRMEARMAMWHPDGDDKPGVLIPAFAELGKPASVPGPLIRAPGGTDVIVMIRNAIPNVTLTVHGLHARPPIVPAGTTFSDSVQIPPGGFQTLRFKLDRPGTYYYWATTTGAAFGNRSHDDSQLSGAIVVDEPGERTPRDRIFVIGMWSDTSASDAVRHRQRQLVTLNGRSWPATDRILYQKGDIVRWRVINTSIDAHAMHLHGFYYRIMRRGDAMADTALFVPTAAAPVVTPASPGRTELVHTERVAPGGTFSAVWVADRLGNWLFHCEEPEHSAARGPLGYPTQALGTRGLGGLVGGVEITRADNDTTWKLPPPAPPQVTRRLRMLLRPNVGYTPTAPLYGVSVLEYGIEPQPADTGQRAGPTIVLNRAEHTSITIVNNLPEATSMHWRGIEGESLYDGVPGFSGVKPVPVRPTPGKSEPAPPTGPIYAPLIAPGDSFEVRLAAPRTGTFAYHAAVGVERQERAGLVGAIVVAEKGKHDPAKEVMVLLSSPSDSVVEEQAVLVNGNLLPRIAEIQRGGTYRLRMLNLTTGRPDLVVELRHDSTSIATWRPMARDGAEIPAVERTLQLGRMNLSIGQIRDVEFPAVRVGEMRLEVKTPAGLLLATLPIRVY
jgi:FtsP/CotA-like multicopper oxidase with cupredoxin domain